MPVVVTPPPPEIKPIEADKRKSSASSERKASATSERKVSASSERKVSASSERETSASSDRKTSATNGELLPHHNAANEMDDNNPTGTFLRPSPSETSLTRSRSLNYPPKAKHSPDCKDNPYKF